MKIPTVMQLVAGIDHSCASFARYVDRELWYAIWWSDDEGLTKQIFEFPIPIDDADGATFLPEDRPITFMRWIRKHRDYLLEAIGEARRTEDDG